MRLSCLPEQLFRSTEQLVLMDTKKGVLLGPAINTFIDFTGLYNAGIKPHMNLFQKLTSKCRNFCVHSLFCEQGNRKHLTFDPEADI